MDVDLGGGSAEGLDTSPFCGGQRGRGVCVCVSHSGYGGELGAVQKLKGDLSILG